MLTQITVLSRYLPKFVGANVFFAVFDAIGQGGLREVKRQKTRSPLGILRARRSAWRARKR